MARPPDSYPPAAPGPGAAPWRCRCGNLLGLLDRRWLFARHRGRAVEANLPARVQCEACGRKQTRAPVPDAPERDRPDATPDRLNDR